MHITRRQLRDLISEIYHKNVMPMKDIMSPEDQHEMRVIQLQNFFLMMRRQGNSNEEIIAATRQALQSILSKQENT
ncbi:hypothetical protein CMI47_21925 [Candidatus Pacearchaeota archaeon]|nr:hypothetical protein [Candidatus Pacearchaeota archaeon]